MRKDLLPEYQLEQIRVESYQGIDRSIFAFNNWFWMKITYNRSMGRFLLLSDSTFLDDGESWGVRFNIAQGHLPIFKAFCLVTFTEN